MSNDAPQHAWPGLNRDRLPRHVAVIMDGNRRWAKRKLLGGFQGHRAGVETVRTLVRLCREVGIPHLTLYAFSTENWQRSDEEVSFLMSLFEEVIQRELDDLHRNQVRLRFIGDVEGLPRTLQRHIRQAEDHTTGNHGLTLNVATNYGARRELVRATQRLAARVQAGTLAVEAIDEAAISAELHTAGQPDPDLLIRTSGEARLSNFLLWQLAYTELYLTDVLWPEFRQPHFLEALLSYQARERRFGGTGGAPSVAAAR
ncbi:MAG: isoprenyl transferase [Candidatus Sericytochromatia bacterium]|nr:isoprenyl transferase [Candidatus Sericytochromatia bacterium]